MSTPAPETHRAAVRGVELAWTEVGTGPTVVWAHGMTSSGWGQERAGMFDWSPVSDAGFRLIRYDARGHGASTGTTEAADYEWSHLADDLLVLLDAIAPGEVIAGMGSSMGTATLIYAALKEPDRFSRLVLTSAPTAWQTRGAQTGMYLGFADLVERDGMAALAAALQDAALPPIFAGLGLTGPDVAAELIPSVFRGAAFSDLPGPEELAAIEAPTLLLPWVGDPGHPVATSEVLLDALPNASLELGSSLAEVLGWGSRAADFLAA